VCFGAAKPKMAEGKEGGMPPMKNYTLWKQRFPETLVMALSKTFAEPKHIACEIRAKFMFV